jgi:hypothetical protein
MWEAGWVLAAVLVQAAVATSAEAARAASQVALVALAAWEVERAAKVVVGCLGVALQAVLRAGWWEEEDSGWVGLSAGVTAAGTAVVVKVREGADSEVALSEAEGKAVVVMAEEASAVVALVEGALVQEPSVVAAVEEEVTATVALVVEAKGVAA